MRKKRRKNKTRFLFIVVFAALIFGAGFFIYQRFFPAVQLQGKSYVYFHIRHGDDMQMVASSLASEGIVENAEAFTWLAEKMELNENIYPGRYRITSGMSPRHIVNLFRYNKQEKVKLSFNTQIRSLDDFVRYTADKLELEPEDLEEYLGDGEWLHREFGLDPASAFALVQPGVFETSWAITAPELFALLKTKYSEYWTATRLSRAKAMGMRRSDVITLASIVQSESGISSEQRKIAGVYMNRLKRGMRLEADPTLKFANRVYDAQRVLDADKLIDSPYNTYRYRGLPPGPICLVSRQALEATLNYERHVFYYFCAKPELNGLSNYSANYEQHKAHAAAYRKALNRLGISR